MTLLNFRLFHHEEIEVNKIDDTRERQAEEHGLKVGQTEDNAHGYSAQPNSQIREGCECPQCRPPGGASEVDRIGNEGRESKGISSAPNDGGQNKHGCGFREGEDDRCHNIGKEAGENHLFSAIEVQYPSTESPAQNQHDGKCRKEKSGIAHSMLQSIKREESG